ncbi:putative cytochrome P450 [Dioscorea sansibarensis]
MMRILLGLGFLFNISLFFVGFITTFALYLYYISWMKPERTRNELRKQGIKGPSPLFFYGNLLEMKRILLEEKARRGRDKGGACHIHHDYTSSVFPYFTQWRKAYGHVFLYTMGNVPALHVSHPDVVKDISLCLSLDLGKATYLKEAHEPLFGHGILKSNGETWAHQRKIIAPEFFLDKVKGMVELMIDSAISLVKLWEEKIEDGGGIVEMKVDDDLRSYSADVISRACFGSSYSKGKEIFSKLRSLQQAVSKPNLLLEITGLRQLPTKKNKEIWKLSKEIHSLILKLVKEKNTKEHQQEQEEDKKKCKNLLEAILNSVNGGHQHHQHNDNKNNDNNTNDDNDDNEDNDDDDNDMDKFIVDNCKTIYFAGHETTAVTATWCLMLLALHPDWQDRARAELVRVCGPGSVPDAQALQKMKLLTMIIQETLRLYPPGAYVTRETLQDMKLGGIHIPKGVNIYVPVPTLHHDPSAWGPNVHRFNPGRFANGVCGACKFPHMYVPFGAGSRTCLGQTFAMTELKIVLSLILSNFSFSLSPKYKHSPVLRLIVEPEFGLDLIVKKV